MNKKSLDERKRDTNHLKIIFSVLIMGISFVAELYIMVLLNGNPIYLAIFGLVFLIFSYVLISSIIQNQYLTSKEEKEDHEGLLKSEKASYLIVKKSFDEIFQRLDSFEDALHMPTEELITAQKAIAKVNINRSRENTDALMNSNDKLLEKMLDFEDVLKNSNQQIIDNQNNSNQQIIDNQNKNIEQQIQNVILRQQELASTIKEMQLSLKSEILQAVNMINANQPQAMPQQPQAMPQQPYPGVAQNQTNQTPIEEVAPQQAKPKDFFNDMAPAGDTPIDTPMDLPPMDDAPIEMPAMDLPLMNDMPIDAPIDMPAMDDALSDAAMDLPPMNDMPIDAPIDLPVMDDAPSADAMLESMAPQGNLEQDIQENANENVDGNTNEEISIDTIPAAEPSDPNKKMSPDDIAALLENLSSNDNAMAKDEQAAPKAEEMKPEAEPEEEPQADLDVPGVDLSDPNKMMSPDDIAALIANL